MKIPLIITMLLLSSCSLKEAIFVEEELIHIEEEIIHEHHHTDAERAEMEARSV